MKFIRKNGFLGLIAGFFLVSLGLLGLATSVSAQTLRTLHVFTGSNGEGANPTDLIQGRDGNFYGTTGSGGGSSTCIGGCGTVFQLDAATGALKTLHVFTGSNGEGANPTGLIQGRDGNFYGTTTYGGGPFYCAPVQAIEGCGTVFQLDAATGALTTLYAFTGNDGYPSSLIQGRDGNFYGATWGGYYTIGILFRMDAATHAVITLYGFTWCYGEGRYPSSLIQGREGNFYGTTAGGGALDCPIDAFGGCGTVFQLDARTGTVTTLSSFTGTNGEGANPLAELLQGRDGNFYGTTLYGGLNCSSYAVYGCGTVFGMDATTHAVSTLYTFTASNSAGAYPSGLIQARDGNFYGTTSSGGSAGYGTVFQLEAKTGTVTTLYSFTGSGGDGANPTGLLQGRDGNFYGTTWDTVFVLQYERK